MKLAFELRCTRGTGNDCFRIETPLVHLKAGEVLALTGPSGSGKSTVLEILGLVLEPERNSRFDWQINVGSADLNIMNLWTPYNDDLLCDLRARQLGFVLQSGGLIPFLNVRENIVLSRLMAGLNKWEDNVDKLIEMLDIGHLLAKKPHQLSVGERQRISIARALAHEPPLLLADEPTAALDPARAEIVMNLLIDLVHTYQSMAVIVTHDHDLIHRLNLLEMRAHLRNDSKTAVFSYGS